MIAVTGRPIEYNLYLGCAGANTQAQAWTLCTCSRQQLFPTHSNQTGKRGAPGVTPYNFVNLERYLIVLNLLNTFGVNSVLLFNPNAESVR